MYTPRRRESLRWCSERARRPTPFTAASVNTRRTFNARVTAAIVSRAARIPDQPSDPRIDARNRISIAYLERAVAFARERAE